MLKNTTIAYRIHVMRHAGVENAPSKQSDVQMVVTAAKVSIVIIRPEMVWADAYGDFREDAYNFVVKVMHAVVMVDAADTIIFRLKSIFTRVAGHNLGLKWASRALIQIQ